jgi:CRP-like cAMP-binding protein
MSLVHRPSNRILQALPEAEFDALRPRLKAFEMVREAILIEAGAALTHVYLPHSGAVSVVVRLSEGQTVEVAMIGRDSVVGVSEALGDGISLTDAIVLFPGSASIIEIADFRTAAAESPTLRSLLARHGLALLAQAQQSAACNASHSVEARMARWLLRARDLWDGETLPMTQELLARMIGVQRNAISIVAHALQRAGVISYSRGHIEILNMEALQAAACECHKAVKAKLTQIAGDDVLISESERLAP